MISESDQKIVTDRIEYLERRLAEAEGIIEIAGCLTHMEVVNAVNYNATHNHFTVSEDFRLVTIDDPIAKIYSLLEKQMIPVFKLLKEKVEKYREKGGAK